MLVLASFAVPRLTLVCVCACSCVGVSISYVKSLKFEGGAMVDMTVLSSQKCTCSAVQRSPGNIIFASCRRRSCANQFLVGLADISVMSTEFAVFLPCMKRFSTLAVYCGKAYSICNK